MRDGNQSLMATKMPREAFGDILPTMDQVGYYSVECWGGATYDSCIRFLNEDPWDRLRFIRKKMPRTRLQMLLRGQNLVGYKHYSDETVRAFVDKAIDEGIDIIRIFDAMNDFENVRVALEEAAKRGGHPSCALCYTVSPVHTADGFATFAKKCRDAGAESICIKDMAGLLTPKKCIELIGKLKEEIDLPIILHSHCIAGQGYPTYYAAIESGVDVLDVAVSAFSGGTSLPATEVASALIRENGNETGCDDEKIAEVNAFFAAYFKEARKKGLIEDSSMQIHPSVLSSQIPGGMYSNLTAQLKAQNTIERLAEVEKEVPRVREDLGYPPLVTPISQIVGAQSLLNVLSGQRYSSVLQETKDYLKGMYGTPPGKVCEDLTKKTEGDVEVGRRGDDFEKNKSVYAEITDALTATLFPEAGKKYLQGKQERVFEPIINLPEPDSLPDIEPLFCEDNDDFVRADLPGLILKTFVKEGDLVCRGDRLLLMESMKMENVICAPHDGVITQITAKDGTFVRSEDRLVRIEKRRNKV